jgi:cholesterol oxidase
MGRDVPDGRLVLRDDRLDSEWKIDKSKDYFDRLQKTMKAMANVWNARYSDNPLWYLDHRVITVHPLGGAPMGRDSKEGVVDSSGRVFDYPGLYVADGSVMPGPVGANPALTIAALSDRFADRLLADAGRS